MPAYTAPTTTLAHQHFHKYDKVFSYFRLIYTLTVTFSPACPAKVYPPFHTYKYCHTHLHTYVHLINQTHYHTHLHPYMHIIDHTHKPKAFKYTCPNMVSFKYICILFWSILGFANKFVINVAQATSKPKGVNIF